MITQILWLLTWPLLIAVSFFVISLVLKKVEKKEDPFT
jgi:hypothetical protein